MPLQDDCYNVLLQEHTCVDQVISTNTPGAHRLLHMHMNVCSLLHLPNVVQRSYVVHTQKQKNQWLTDS